MTRVLTGPDRVCSPRHTRQQFSLPPLALTLIEFAPRLVQADMITFNTLTDQILD